MSRTQARKEARKSAVSIAEAARGQSPNRQTPRLEQPRILATLIFLAAFGVYINSLGGQFVFDDTSIIQNNPQIRSLDWSSLRHLFGSHYWQAVEGQGGLYRPVVVLSYAINYAIGGLNPWGYHFVNVLLHGLNSALVFLIILELFQDRLFALWSGLLFALHPIHTEAVAYVVGRAESLAALFFLAAWWLYLRRRMAPAAAAFLLAVLTKESAFTFLAVLPMSDYISERRFVLSRYWPFALTAALALGLRYAALGGLAPLYINPTSNPLAGAPLGARLLTATAVFWKYSWLLIFPVPLSADYSFNQIPLITSAGDLGLLLGATVLTLLVAAGAWSVRRSPALLLCTVFFLAAFSLTSNFIRPIGTIMAERLLYLPSIGFTCALAWGIAQAGRSPRKKDIVTAAAVLLAVLYAGRTVLRNSDWHDHLALFSSAAVVSPNSSLVQANLANALLNQRGDGAGAVEHAREAIRIEPGDPAARMTLAQAYERLGDLPHAAQAFAEVERLAPGSPGAQEAARRRRAIEQRLAENAPHK